MKNINKFQIISFDQMNEYENLRKLNYVGFAHFYLKQCSEKSKSNDEIDIEVFTQLVALDAKLGTTASKQLYWCVYYTLRLDIIKVEIQRRVFGAKIILVDKYGTC